MQLKKNYGGRFKKLSHSLTDQTDKRKQEQRENEY